MKQRFLPLVVSLLGCLLPETLHGQTRQDVQQILSEAVRFARDNLFVRQPYLSGVEGGIVVDPFSRAVRGGSFPETYQDGQMRDAISAVVNGQSGTVEQAYHCPEPMRRCNLNGAVALIAMGAPILQGDTALVHVRTLFVALFRGELPSAVASKRVAEMWSTVVLGRERGGWKIVREEHGPVS